MSFNKLICLGLFQMAKIFDFNTGTFTFKWRDSLHLGEFPRFQFHKCNHIVRLKSSMEMLCKCNSDFYNRNHCFICNQLEQKKLSTPNSCSSVLENFQYSFAPICILMHQSICSCTHSPPPPPPTPHPGQYWGIFTHCLSQGLAISLPLNYPGAFDHLTFFTLQHCRFF